jgi:general secretion pathway protein L
LPDTLVLFLPSQTVAAWRWLRIVGGSVTGRGEGIPAIEADAGVDWVAVAPADAVTLHWAELPERSLAQSVAAARILVAEASATPIGELHVAVGREGDQIERPIGVVAASQIHAWLAMLAERGVDPGMLLPAPTLLPRPETGYLRADLGGEGVVRGTASGFADEALLTELVTGGVAPATLTREDLEAAIVATIAAPALDLRQGIFARTSRIGVDWAMVRRIGWLSAAIIGATLLITLVQLLRYSTAADDLERRTDLLARTGLARGEAVSNADRQLSARLERLRGGGLGFSRTSAAVFGAVRATPGSELRSLAFEPSGAMRITIGTQSEGQVLDLERHLEAAGLAASPQGQFQSAGGRLSGDLLVKPR